MTVSFKDDPFPAQGAMRHFLMALSRPYRILNPKPYSFDSALPPTIAAAGSVLEPMNYRAFAAAAKLLGALASSDAVACVRMFEDFEFEFPLRDFYWNRLLCRRYAYEPELACVLDRLRTVPYGLVDCGANFGYWSLYASGEVGGRHPVVAVEASGATFSILSRNLQMNDRNVLAMHAAIGERDNEIVTLYTRGSHAGASTSEQWFGNRRSVSNTEDVRTLTVDAAASSLLTEGLPVVAKLDVEGAEVAALRGSQKLLDGESMFIFEEYGGDPRCAVAIDIMERLALPVYYVDEANGQARELASVHDVRAIKTKPTKGYNFFAVTRGSVFHETLLEMTMP